MTTAAGLRVLLVEDDADARATLAEFLQMLGHEVHEAGSADAGLQAALSFRPQAVFCDLGLPGKDGFVFVQALRAQAGAPRPAVTALTGYDRPEDRARASEAGFDSFMVKPVGLDAIERFLAGVA